MNNTPANMILLSEFTPLESKKNQVLQCIKNITSNRTDSCVYISEDEGSILEIKSISALSDLDSSYLFDTKEFDKNLASDIQRQVLRLKNIVKPQESILPESKYLQLRHIEVPLHILEEYHMWRDQTIFSHVVKQSEIESFLAYHSIISTEPGVMFLSGFSCKIDDYLSGFKKPEYIDIVKQAGEKYIFGGQAGLYTKIYKRLD